MPSIVSVEVDRPRRVELSRHGWGTQGNFDSSCLSVQGNGQFTTFHIGTKQVPPILALPLPTALRGRRK